MLDMGSPSIAKRLLLQSGHESAAVCNAGVGWLRGQVHVQQQIMKAQHIGALKVPDSVQACRFGSGKN